MDKSFILLLTFKNKTAFCFRYIYCEVWPERVESVSWCYLQMVDFGNVLDEFVLLLYSVLNSLFTFVIMLYIPNY